MTCDRKMDDIWRMEPIVTSPSLESAEDVRTFIRCLTTLIYDYKMVGLIYQLYDENVEYHKQSGIRLFSPDEIARQITDFTAAFPNLHAEIDNIIVYRESEVSWKVFRRIRFQGNNTAPTSFGPATGKSLGDRCFNLTMLYLRQVQGQWKIVFEANSDSESLLHRVQTADVQEAQS